MNKFRTNLHQVLFNNPETQSGNGIEDLRSATQKELKDLEREAINESEIRNNIINEYLIRVNEIEKDLSRKNYHNKFHTIYYNLIEYHGWRDAKMIDKNSGRKIKTMNYVLAAFIYMKEHKVKTLNDTIFAKIFGGLEKQTETIVTFYNAYLEVQNEKEKLIQESDKHRSKSPSETRRNNESLASSAEKQEEAITDKKLQKQLDQLAKNKNIDFSWTDNEWKCSRKEKSLACASARVFQQLLEKGTLNQMLEECKFRNTPLSKEDAEARGMKYNINSKPKDIQKFHQAYQEYQNPQSEYQHLKNLMGFFCESNFEDLESVRTSLTERSKKISKKEINEKKDELYKNGVKKPKDRKQRASFEVIKDRLNQGSESQTNKMLTLLGDFNLDGEVNSGDVGYRTGSQLADVFRRTVATLAIENKNFNDDVAVKNLVDYANTLGLHIDNIKTVKDLYSWMTNSNNGYENTKKLQELIKTSPSELSDILRNGEKAGEESLNRITKLLDLNEEEQKRVNEAAKEKAEEIISNGEERLKELVEDENKRADITQQLRAQLPTMLINNAKMHKDGLSTGLSVPLDQIIKGASAGFSVGIGRDGKPQFGLFLGWDRKFNLSDRTQLSTAVTGGTKLLFVPIFSGGLELSHDVNKGSREKSLRAKGEHILSYGGNVTVVGPIFSYGFTAGYENKKLQGIEKQAVHLNNVIREQVLNRIKPLQTVRNTPEAKKISLKNSLKQEFPKASEEELNRAVNNLFSIIKGFKIDEKSTDKDFKTYAQIVADVYSEIWRNESVAGIADNKRKISGGKVGIQLVEGCVPIVSLIAKFTRYRNARTNETDFSRGARIDAKVNGTGNRIVKLDSKEIGESQVSQINEVLKGYGASSLLKYGKGSDGKPGRIWVPASIANGIGINVRVSRSLQGMVKELTEKDYGGEKHHGGETYYSFPANATYRLLQETGGNQRSITLNIGSDKDESSDIMLSDSGKMRELIGNKELVIGKKWKYKENFEDKGSIEYRPDFMDSLFTQDVIEGLKTIDSSNRRKFSEFMRTKRDAIESFDEMVNALKTVLGNSEKYQPIIEKLNDAGVSDGDKQLIIDRIMSISAYAKVHDKAGLELNVKQRGNRYKESGERALKGPNGQSIFDKLEDINREELINSLDNYESVFMPDIIGVTAFYNRNNKAKGLALTGLGATNVLGGKTQTLSDRDSKKAENWFLGGTNENGDNVPGSLSKEKSPQERNNVMRNVKEKLPNGTILTDNNVKDLLKGKEIELTIDNTQKKIIVKIEKEFVSYLMGECANESIGMKLKILVKEQQQVDNYTEGRLYLNNSDGSSSVSVEESNRAFGIAFGGGEKGKKADGETKPGEIEGDITGGDGTTVPGAKDGGKTGDGTTDPGAKDGSKTGEGTTNPKPGSSGGGGGNGRSD